MTKYEYRVEEIRKSKYTAVVSIEDNNTMLKECGAKGWKLIDINQGSIPLIFLFERVIDEPYKFYDYKITQGESISQFNPLLNPQANSSFLTGLGLNGWKVSKIIGGYPNPTYFILEHPLDPSPPQTS